MGRPNAQTKRVKRRRQKEKRYSKTRLPAPSPSTPISATCTSNGQNDLTSSNIVHQAHYKGSNTLNDLPSTHHTPHTVSNFACTESEPSHHLHSDRSTPACNTELGDADLDVIEMDLYDAYRKDDGDLHTNTYLLKCTNKLRKKYEHVNREIHRLCKENLKIRLETKEEKERIRKFYETIAFARSRTGLMVREAMGTSPSAERMMQELKSLYDVDQDSNYT